MRAAPRSWPKGRNPARSNIDVFARPLAPRGGSRKTTGVVCQPLAFHEVLAAQHPDCERVRDHGMAQPVNTLTSAAYGVASLPVWLAARRSTGLVRIELHAYAGALLAVMAGSVRFHARVPGSSHRLHDGSLYVAVSLGLLLLLPHAEPVADSRAWRRFLLAAATAGAAYAGGRSSSRFCRPDSLLQLHGLWHVLSAGAAALVALAATDGRHEQRTAGHPSVGDGLPHRRAAVWCHDGSAHRLHVVHRDPLAE